MTAAHVNADSVALLAAIHADPDDDLPRLAYADWLEENGERARAEFIQLQLRKAADPKSFHGFLCLPEQPCRNCRREAALLAGHGMEWAGGRELCLRRGVLGVSLRFVRGFVGEAVCPTQEWLDHGPSSLALWPLILAVELSDRAPIAWGKPPSCAWLEDSWEGGMGHLDYAIDPRLYRRLRHGESPPGGRRVYPDTTAAKKDLSDACLRYAGRIRL